MLNKEAGFSAGDVEFLELMGGHMAQALANVLERRLIVKLTWLLHF